MTPPIWITPSNLGSYIETYSFNVTPLVISFAAASGSIVTQLNGSLPDSLQWIQQNNTVVITGESVNINTPVLGQITWRITDTQGQVSDRTYIIAITPVENAPSWAGQLQFLGYAASNGTSTYTVVAHTDTATPILYSIPEFTPPTGMSINSQSGVITYAAPSVTYDVTTAFTVRATTGTLYSDLPVTITVLTVPHAPAWVTDSGLIAEALENQFVEVPIAAYDSSGSAINYSVISSTPAFPFTLLSNSAVSNQAVIYGSPPVLYTTTVYQFAITATSINGASTRTFDIIINPNSIGALLYWANESADLGTVLDGRFQTLDVRAVSTTDTIVYSIVGGILPLTMTLNRSQGFISGFMEFQTRDRDYFFDVRADDGLQVIQRRFQVTVKQGVKAPYMGITIPLEGSLKDIYYNYVGTVINSNWVPYSNSTPQEILFTPYVQLINGLDYAIDNPSTAMNFANLHLYTSEVMIGAVTNVNVSPSTTLFYSPILDNAQGANSSLTQVANVIATSTDTVAVAKGTVTFYTDSRTTAASSVVYGTRLKIIDVNDPTVWMQGPVTFVSNYVITIDSMLTSGAGTRSDWNIYFAPVYPPSLENIRNDLIAGLGWVTAGAGSGAELQAIVDIVTTGIGSVNVIYPGSGYLYRPEIVVSGGANVAVIASNLTVVGYTIHNAGNNWTTGTEITLTPTNNSPAVISIGNVTSSGGIVDLNIIDGGNYTEWPAGDTLLITNAGQVASIQFNLGILDCRVLDPGAGYSTNTVSVSAAGRELLPDWQQTWSPYLGIGTVYTDNGADVVTRETASVTSQLYYQRWPLQHMILELQGISWTGDTTFDGLATQWDGGATFFAEWLEPKDTIFDTNLEIFDQGNTRFDDDYALWQQLAYLTWGTTLFDQEFTIFDLYSTIFDPGFTSTQSITLLRRLLRVITPQISGHNVVV
jgi:hypothetical protein